MSMKMVAVATCYMGINDNFNYFFSMKWLVFEKRSRKTLEKALLIYKGKEDELRLHLRREHLFGYDISKEKR